MGFVQNAIAFAFRAWVKDVKKDLAAQDYNKKLTDAQVQKMLKDVMLGKRQSYITNLGVGVYQAYLEGVVDAGFGLDEKAVKNLAYNYASKIIDYSNQMTSLAAAEAYRGIMNRTKKPYEAFSFMEKTFGVDRRSVRTLLNMFDSKDPENKTLVEQDSARAKKMDQYVAAAVNVRAKTFGEEEAFGAKETSKALVWNLAKVQGLTPENAKKRWITVKDELTCAVCGPMHYRTVELNEKFTLVDGKEVWGPQLHPNCRCKAVMVVTLTSQEKRGSVFDRLKARGKVEKSFNDNDWQSQPRSNDGRFGSRGRVAVMERGTQVQQTTQAPRKVQQHVQQDLSVMSSDELHTRGEVLRSKFEESREKMTYGQQQAARFEIARTGEAYRRRLREEHPDIDWLVPQAKPVKVVNKLVNNKLASTRPDRPEPDVELTTKLLAQVAELPRVQVSPTFNDSQVKEMLEPKLAKITVARMSRPVLLKLNPPKGHASAPHLATLAKPKFANPVYTNPVLTTPTLDIPSMVPSHTISEIVSVVNSQVESPAVATVDIPKTIKAQNPDAEVPDLVQLDGFMSVITPDEKGLPERLGQNHVFTTSSEEITANVYDAYQSAADLVMRYEIADGPVYIRTGRNDVIELSPQEIGMVVDSYARMLAARQVEGLGLDKNIDPDEPFGSVTQDIHSERVFSYGTYKDGGDLDTAQVPVQEVADHLSLEDMFATYEPKIVTVEYIDHNKMSVEEHADGAYSTSLPVAMKYTIGENFHGMDMITLEGMEIPKDETFTPDESDMAAFNAEFGEEYHDDEW